MQVSLASIRALMIDADGVLWHGGKPLAGVPAFFDFLRARQIRFLIATNNSAPLPLEIVNRLAQMGAPIDASEVLTSAQATARYLPRLAPRGARLYVVGGEGLTQALAHAGYRLVEAEADVVVVGLDTRLTYAKLNRATREIRRGAAFVGTNGDKTYPAEDGVIPGAGSLLAALQAATDVAPIVIGKPERAMFDIAVETLGMPRAQTAILGDRLETDVEGAQRAGMKSILVLTGITTRALLAQSAIQPDWVFENLDALREEWQRSSKR